MKRDRAAALEQCRKLLYQYRPLLDKLLVARLETIKGLLAEEKQLGLDTCRAVDRAFGKAQATQFVYMAPIRATEEAEMVTLGIVQPDILQHGGLGTPSTSPVLSVPILSEDHRQAMMACVWRSHRLAELLRSAPAPRATSEAEIRALYNKFGAAHPDLNDRALRQLVEHDLGKTRRQVYKAVKQPNR